VAAAEASSCVARRLTATGRLAEQYNVSSRAHGRCSLNIPGGRYSKH
jgi:hypothetical protein